jgi:hypothetical protein
MQSYMKPTPQQREILSRRIREAQAKLGLTNAEIALAGKVDASQVSRICSGQFQTVSHNVLQICNVLGVDTSEEAGRARSQTAVETLAAGARAEAAWKKLEISMKRAWDKTPEGAKRLTRILDAIAEVSRRG